MKKFILCIFLALILTACSSETNSKNDEHFSFTVETLEKRISEALSQIGNKTDLEIISNEKTEDGKQSIALSEDIFIFAKTNEDGKVSEVTLAALPKAADASKEELNTAFLILIGTVDDTLSMGDRNKVKNELEIENNNLFDHTKVHINKNIVFTYKGTDENILLQATPK